MKKSHYNEEFYKIQQNGSRESAREIVPMVLELINAKSVVDVGCGVGTWLSVFKEKGIDDIVGFDGEYVNTDMLHIPKEKFNKANLEKPLKVDRKFDLAVSLEVAEHLPDQCADTFVESLTNASSTVLFSAAIPLQGGTNHINEQWPQYWVEKFENRGYCVIDCIREKVWHKDNVESWYAQNILLFVKKELIESNQVLKEKYEQTNKDMLSLVHPKLYLIRAANQKNKSIIKKIYDRLTK